MLFFWFSLLIFLPLAIFLVLSLSFRGVNTLLAFNFAIVFAMCVCVYAWHGTEKSMVEYSRMFLTLNIVTHCKRLLFENFTLEFIALLQRSQIVETHVFEPERRSSDDE